jgi:8-oxo-dGTP diphosphatase
VRTKFPVTVHIFFLRDQRVLLARRCNTGYEDGNYSVVAGHVEQGESITQAAIREVEEEVGVELRHSDVRVVGVMIRKSDDQRVDFFAAVTQWRGDVANREPDRCDDLAWFPIDGLPENVVGYVRRALQNYERGVWFDEYGWAQ